jgi:hypothetical protein
LHEYFLEWLFNGVEHIVWVVGLATRDEAEALLYMKPSMSPI